VKQTPQARYQQLTEEKETVKPKEKGERPSTRWQVGDAVTYYKTECKGL